jgi:putative DNA primase/helicase
MNAKSKDKHFNKTDAGNGELFAHLFEGRVLFDHKQGRWLVWEAKRARWRPDATKRVRLLAKNVAKEWFRIAQEMSREDEGEKAANFTFKWAYKSESAGGIDATLKQSQTEPSISDEGERWDADPWLFGVANGVVDLQTGKFRAGTQTDRITKFSPVAFDPAAKCPRFLKFMDEIFAGDADLIRYVQKAIGYSLTGETREQCLFACWGKGSNGKTTLLELLFHIVGDYGKDLPFASLEAKQHRIGDGVNLIGSRFVKAVEVREGVVLDEGRIKAWTGGDTITVRPFYRNEFSFLPQFKLWMGFNHKPQIVDDSVAMWRRIQLIPFTQTFDVRNVDKELAKKLRAEAPGILNWMLAGCLGWQAEGLTIPEAVERATTAYADESDHLSTFLEECCDTGALLEVPKTDLRACYESWCSAHKQRPKNKNDFPQALKSRGFGEGANSLFRYWTGLRLKARDANDATNGISTSFPENTHGKRSRNGQSSVTSVTGTENKGDRDAQLAAPNGGFSACESPENLAAIPDLRDLENGELIFPPAKPLPEAESSEGIPRA